MKFGDILKYPESSEWRFMFLNRYHRARPLSLPSDEYINVLVVQIEPDDDLWIAGETILAAGINELVPAHD